MNEFELLSLRAKLAVTFCDNIKDCLSAHYKRQFESLKRPKLTPEAKEGLLKYAELKHLSDIADNNEDVFAKIENMDLLRGSLVIANVFAQVAREIGIDKFTKPFPIEFYVPKSLDIIEDYNEPFGELIREMV